MTASKRGLALALALIALSSFHARAQSLDAFVGTWYSETKEDSLVEGKPYDIRRQVIVNRADGTKTNTVRYYLNGQRMFESAVTYRWGVDNSLYWTICQTVLANGQASTCSNRQEYDIISVGAKEIRYKSRSSGTIYSMLRVTADFQLP